MCDGGCNDEVGKGSDGRDREKAQDTSFDVSWAVGASFFKNYYFFISTNLLFLYRYILLLLTTRDEGE